METAMSQDFSVVVGVADLSWGYDHLERENLARKIEKAGFEVERVKALWPRDRYVFIDGKYLTRQETGFCSEGGYFQFGKDFVLVSEKVFSRRKRYKNLKGLQVLEEAKKYFPERRIHLAPIGKTYRETFFHVDLSTLVVSSRNLLIVDKYFYSNKQIAQFEQIADSEHLTLEIFEPKESGLLFALNSLVLPYQTNEEVIFSNARTPSFSELLKRFDLRNVRVDMPLTHLMKGSIHCCTNAKDKTRKINDLIDPEFLNNIPVIR